MSENIVITAIARTPMGGFQGVLTDASAAELGAAAIRAAVERSQLQGEDIDEVIMGCVLPAGQGQAPARQASLAAGLPLATGCTTINKMCGSGMKAAMFANDLLKAGSNRVMVAGGLESMTNAPYILTRARAGMRMGHGQVYDHMFLDGLEDAYDKGKLMGVFAEATADKYGFSREQQDEFAIASLRRAQAAIESGAFKDEITPVVIKTRKGEVTVDTDEQPFNANIEKIPSLRAAFRQDGTVTAANSSSISDGGAALVLMGATEAEKRGIQPLAVIRAHATHAQEPAWFTTAPVGALKKVLEAANWSSDEVDLYEINEAFAVVTMAAMQDLGLDHARVNVNGGACALGHPIGASGARIIVTLIAALQNRGLKKGVAGLCIGGGEATAVALELL
ncbi:MAG: acetyl-CoA C-acyltransferase [Gammaproteobacteria bacterium]|nr:MAG: acetyl-CoA C-acyltransferase [Gammaproteobacteria bacterium]UCH40429.1 MAG: acetyl-CoA C-acyltransferase [Gammaproteobacteria bacterium]